MYTYLVSHPWPILDKTDLLDEFPNVSDNEILLYESYMQFIVFGCRGLVIKDSIAVFSYIVMCRFSSFSSFSSTNGGGIPSRNVRSVSTSTKTVNGKTIVTKRFVDLASV